MRSVSSSTKAVRLFGTQARRTLVASLVLLLALAALIALPAYAAGKTPPTAGIAATATACVYTVTYTWSGFSGTNVYIRVIYQDAGQQFATAAVANNIAVSGRSGSVSVALTVPSGEGFHRYFGRASMYNARNQEVRNSQATSASSITATC